MLTEKFDRLFLRLVASFKRYQEVHRSPDTVVAIGSARTALDLARADIAVERKRIIGDRSVLGVSRQTAVSEDDLARLRVFGTGFVSG